MYTYRDEVQYRAMLVSAALFALASEKHDYRVTVSRHELCRMTGYSVSSLNLAIRDLRATVNGWKVDSGAGTRPSTYYLDMPASDVELAVYASRGRLREDFLIHEEHLNGMQAWITCDLC